MAQSKRVTETGAGIIVCPPFPLFHPGIPSSLPSFLPVLRKTSRCRRAAGFSFRHLEEVEALKLQKSTYLCMLTGSYKLQKNRVKPSGAWTFFLTLPDSSILICLSWINDFFLCPCPLLPGCLVAMVAKGCRVDSKSPPCGGPGPRAYAYRL